MRPAPIHAVAWPRFVAATGCDVVAVPRNIVLCAFLRGERRWIVAPVEHCAGDNFETRVPITLRWLDQSLEDGGGPPDGWFPLCSWDGWRERVRWSPDYRRVPPGDLAGRDEWRGAPGELPAWSAQRDWVACYAGQRGDPSARLLPEPYWLMLGGYARLFEEARAAARPWGAREPRAIFCGSDHGEAANLFAPPPSPDLHPRRLLRAVVDAGRLPVDVMLGGQVPMAAQLARRWILDVDGMVRTFDAFAWKLASGSLVLAQDSPWETWFTREFRPWEHYVPVANDFADLAARLDWCRDHDDECRRIAEAAAARAAEVYDPVRVARDLDRRWRAAMAGAPA